MIILAAVICLQLDRMTIGCQTHVIRTERTPAECVAMIEPVKAWLRDAAAGLPVVLIEAQCRGGGLV